VTTRQTQGTHPSLAESNCCWCVLVSSASPVLFRDTPLRGTPPRFNTHAAVSSGYPPPMFKLVSGYRRRRLSGVKQPLTWFNIICIGNIDVSVLKRQPYLPAATRSVGKSTSESLGEEHRVASGWHQAAACVTHTIQAAARWRARELIVPLQAEFARSVFNGAIYRSCLRAVSVRPRREGSHTSGGRVALACVRRKGMRHGRTKPAGAARHLRKEYRRSNLGVDGHKCACMSNRSRTQLLQVKIVARRVPSNGVDRRHPCPRFPESW
jgi:hypothetical protein